MVFVKEYVNHNRLLLYLVYCQVPSPVLVWRGKILGWATHTIKGLVTQPCISCLCGM